MKGGYGEGRAAPSARIQQRECQSFGGEGEEEEEEGEGCGNKKTRNASGADEASIEVARRPRGRPPGSKNKPKPPLVITREATDSPMRPHILHIPGGLDIVDAISRFARRRNFGLCILTGTGSVANVTLRHPTSSTITFHGRFEILSISATFLPPSSSSSSSSSPSPLSSLSNGFTVSLVGAQGQIVGGSVVGSLLAASTVIVVAATFVNPTFHRLSVEDEFSGSGVPVSEPETSTHLHPHHQQQVEEHHHHGHDPHLMDGSSSGLSVYSCHLPSDVIWAPIPRPPPPY